MQFFGAYWLRIEHILVFLRPLSAMGKPVASVGAISLFTEDNQALIMPGWGDKFIAS